MVIKMILKRILSLILSFFIVVCFVGCSKAEPKKSFDKDVKSYAFESGVVAENEKYILEFDGETMGVTLTERLSGLKWGSSPFESGEPKLDELGMPIKKNNSVNSAITVCYKRSSSAIDMGNNEVNSYSDAVLDGRTVCKEIENGIRVEYYFDNQEFMVPVDYVLYDDYVSVSVDPSLIDEGDENLISSIALAPFWCSAENDSDNAYLFVPSGSGALVSTDSVSSLGGKFEASVYGKDYSEENWYTAVNTKDIRMPVFGVKNGNFGSFAIIDSGDEAAEIVVTSGSTVYNYSSVYAKFNLRGSTYHLAEVYDNETAAMTIFTDNFIEEKISVRFYPLTEEYADYSGMANIYRNYLISELGLKKNGSQVRMNLNIIGGTVTTKSFLGVPYKTLQPATTVEQAADIVLELGKQTKDITATLKGFGESGVNIGKIAGGYKISNKLGTVKEIKGFAEQCKDNNIQLYTDFETVKFGKSSASANTFFDSVYAASHQRTTLYLSDKAVHDNVKESLYYLLSQNKFLNVFEKITKKVKKWGIDGVSAASLTSMTYSNYRDTESSQYYSKVGFSNQVRESILEVKKAGLKFASADANIYAALLSDTVNNTPTTSTRSHVFMCDIPFYQMVLRGYIPMTTESINLSDNSFKTLLFAVESGIGIEYTLISKWDELLINSEYPYFYSTVYSGLKDEIIENCNRLKFYYDCIKDSVIVSHNILDSGVRETVFDNGTRVFVNYNSAPAMCPLGEVAACDFIVKEG